MKNEKLKKFSLLLITIIITMLAVSCGNKQEQSNKKTGKSSAKTSRTIFGTIKSIDKNTRVMGFDDLEIIRPNQKERMKQIGITDKDFSNYYLYNASKEIKNYKIKDNASIIIFGKDPNYKISTDINGLYNQVESGYENNYDIKVEGEYVVEIVQHLLEP